MHLFIAREDEDEFDASHGNMVMHDIKKTKLYISSKVIRALFMDAFGGNFFVVNQDLCDNFEEKLYRYMCMHASFYACICQCNVCMQCI